MCEIIKNQVFGKEFFYCREHKVEVNNPFCCVTVMVTMTKSASVSNPSSEGFKIGDRVEWAKWEGDIWLIVGENSDSWKIEKILSDKVWHYSCYPVGWIKDHPKELFKTARKVP
jgi:hypothetical protein